MRDVPQATAKDQSPTSELKTVPAERSLRSQWPIAAATLLVAAAVFTTAVVIRGGMQVTRGAPFELAAILLSLPFLVAAVVSNHSGRRWGVATLSLLGLLTVITGASILWSVQPAESWLKFNRTVAYLMIFAGSMAAVKLFSSRWRVLINGLLLGLTAVAAYGLIVKVFPAQLSPDEIFARARAPYEYWNAVGLSAALGVPLALWLACQRSYRHWITSLAYPATTLLLVVVVLSYSRGALVALFAGLALWFTLSPQRLRGLALAATTAGATLLLSLWVFGQDALTLDRISIAERVSASRTLGLLSLLALVLTYLIGLAINRYFAKNPLTQRARQLAGKAVLAISLTLTVIFMVGLSFSDKGPIDRVKSNWESLTSEDAATPNQNDASRFVQTSSVRSQYWHIAADIFNENQLTGVGAGGYATARKRFRDDSLEVRHAHGYIAQTAADLGLLGLAANLVLLVAWLAAASRTLLLRRGQLRQPRSTEQIGMLALLSSVVIFGVHSLVDWTWFIPGTTTAALLMAGWLAGRGPVNQSIVKAEGERSRSQVAKIGSAAVTALVVVFACWTVWLPWAAHKNDSEARTLSSQQKLAQAEELSLKAMEQNPLSVEPLFTLAQIADKNGNSSEAVQYLEDAVKLQPGNPISWERLAEFQLEELKRPEAALKTLSAALYLDPSSTRVQSQFVFARQIIAAQEQLRREKARFEREERIRKRLLRKLRKEKQLSQQNSLNAQPTN